MTRGAKANKVQNQYESIEGCYKDCVFAGFYHSHAQAVRSNVHECAGRPTCAMSRFGTHKHSMGVAEEAAWVQQMRRRVVRL